MRPIEALILDFASVESPQIQQVAHLLYLIVELSFPEYLEFIHFDLQISLHRTDKRSKQLLRNNSLQVDW
ncbi:hypothetical protein BHM03_00003082 [Ensete ventricosum]|nr:hypothetical protein BHM03_00003082 [Ensete ventricosum]